MQENGHVFKAIELSFGVGLAGKTMHWTMLQNCTILLDNTVTEFLNRLLAERNLEITWAQFEHKEKGDYTHIIFFNYDFN